MSVGVPRHSGAHGTVVLVAHFLLLLLVGESGYILLDRKGVQMINKMKKQRKALEQTPCTITVYGEPASKANSRRLVMMGGKPRFIKSKKALGYSSSFNKQINSRKELIDNDVCVAIKVFYKTRRPDLDESLILDLMEEKIYKNDRQVKIKYIEHGLDKENPRAVIVVGPVDQKELVISTLHSALEKEEGRHIPKE
tara:strand:+ start:1866 stop:2453 length:588 start_codon:yes stop_codon:yes gene_type:complete